MKDENDRLRTDSTQVDREAQVKVRDMERDITHLNEQNEIMSRSIKDKELCIGQLERTLIELKRENQNLIIDMA
jgi:predicted RNase H-like nuclease (RuvC/YqgF family)